eukprot:CAMPEP_0172211604 /NCGR_PEP_ID=MMETSP1050-20130122/36506_1 /TAXON_ID=233186 /ORGANISM="Cryptomonas curvata, Strain CCAP979/52" /LENGTH=300 /DNA_ID=CAMNT_0012892097 /DNA_START=208 /DNA_END=1108 /DNA_ORIENTATION=-
MRDFLSQLLIGDGKIFSIDTKFTDISYIQNEYIQNAPPELAKKIICDIVLSTNKGQVVIEMQKNCYPQEQFLNRIGFYASSLHTNQEILHTGKDSMGDYQNVDRVVLISVVGGYNNLFEMDVPFVSYHSFTESTTHKKLIHPIDFVIIELKKFIDEVHEPRNFLEEWIWLLAHNDIDYDYTNKHVQSAVQRIKVIMRDEFATYEKCRRDEIYRDRALSSAMKDLKVKEEEIKKKDEKINLITKAAIEALCPTSDNKEEIASKLECSISMVEDVMKTIPAASKSWWMNAAESAGMDQCTSG